MGIVVQILAMALVGQLALLSLVAEAAPPQSSQPIPAMSGSNLTYLGDANGKSFYVDASQRMNWEDAQEYCKSFNLTAATVTIMEETSLLYYKIPQGLWSSIQYSAPQSIATKTGSAAEVHALQLQQDPCDPDPTPKNCGMLIKVNSWAFWGIDTRRYPCSDLAYALCEKPI